MGKHAMLSASGASRWLTCTPSARLELEVDAIESSYADEGTLAHDLSEHLIRHLAYGIDISSAVNTIQQNKLYNEEMMDYCMQYAQFVVDEVKSIPGSAMLLQEQHLDLTEWIPEGFGRLDVGIGSDKVMKIIDLKYGKGVPVDAYENKQLMVYALGMLKMFSLVYDFDTIEMTIYQPRIDNISSYEISVENLLKWARETLRPTAIEAFEGRGDLIAGDHCRFCRVKSICKANARLNLAVAARDFDPATISDENISKILLKAQQFKNWISSVETYALHQAIGGKKFPGLKLVKGRSVRKIDNEEAILEGLRAEGFKDEQIVNKKIANITTLSKIVPKLVFEKVVAPFLVKPPGAPTLVSENDGRPEWNFSESAADDFKVIEVIED